MLPARECYDAGTLTALNRTRPAGLTLVKICQMDALGIMLDKFVTIPVLALAFSAIISPLAEFFGTTADIRSAEPGLINRLFWPLLTLATIILVARNFSRLRKAAFFTPPLISLIALVAFAAASIMWAYKPPVSATRFLQQSMILACLIIPGMLAPRTSDLMRGAFLCLALAAILNVFFIPTNDPNGVPGFVPEGYTGYLLGKNYLGEFATIAFLFSLHEILYSGFRRTFGILIGATAIALLLLSMSKTAYALAFICPFIAWIMLTIRKMTRTSLAAILLCIPVFYTIVSSISNFNMNRISFMLYGDSTFTGRTIIWDFADYEISARPLFGWGYQGFWLIGNDAPSVTEAPGFVKDMPNGHNGYYDVTLELGYVGYALLLTFIYATVHAIGRAADADRRRGWFLLSTSLYIIGYNFLESLWMRGSLFLWVVFLLLTVEISRHWHPVRPIRASNQSPLRTRVGLRVEGGPRPRTPMKPLSIPQSIDKNERK
jgi:O-antigen ligase